MLANARMGARQTVDEMKRKPALHDLPPLGDQDNRLK